MLKIFRKKDKSDTLKLLSKLIKDIINVNDDQVINEETRFEDIGFDSMKFISLLLSLEDILSLNIEEVVEKVDLNEIEKVGDLKIVLEQL